MCCGVSGDGTLELLREAILGDALSGTGLVGFIVTKDTFPGDTGVGGVR